MNDKLEHSPQWFLTVPAAHGNTGLKGPLGSLSAKLGDDSRQQLYVILFLK